MPALRALGTGLALMASLSAGTAQALSCLQPDPALSYAEAAASDDAYLVVTGELTHDAGSGTIQEATQMPARIAGHFLKGSGFSEPMDIPVTLALSCVSVWCSSAPESGSQVLAFLKETPTGYVLDLPPCGGWMFQDARDDQIKAVTICHTGGSCEAGQ
ncbi:hypothetical protein [Pseudooceanicola nitratireducens]|uniref:hypothetical protein n=1 Tax=Pseudooceanicola nitratireducens TaxID=517719 RepID=UPI003C7E52EE